jgi:hypothetical protein
MATDTTATIIALPQPDRAAAKREAARLRKQKSRAKAKGNSPHIAAKRLDTVTPAPVTPVTPPVARRPVTPVTRPVTASRPSIAQVILIATAFGLAAVGITMNGWYAHSLGSSQIAGWVFAAIGVAADAIALATPHCAASHWQASQRTRALAGWAVWFLVVAFTFYAGIGFASVNISDVTASRAERVTSAVTDAQAALKDAADARDRECRGGTGKFCREREAAVTERRKVLDAAQASVSHRADPQVEAAKAIVAWVTFGWLKPSSDDFAMLRLVLLSLLPQIGGILLMLSRRQ